MFKIMSNFFVNSSFKKLINEVMEANLFALGRTTTQTFYSSFQFFLFVQCGHEDDDHHLTRGIVCNNNEWIFLSTRWPKWRMEMVKKMKDSHFLQKLAAHTHRISHIFLLMSSKSFSFLFDVRIYSRNLKCWIEIDRDSDEVSIIIMSSVIFVRQCRLYRHLFLYFFALSKAFKRSVMCVIEANEMWVCHVWSKLFALT